MAYDPLYFHNRIAYTERLVYVGMVSNDHFTIMINFSKNSSMEM